jgi:hypothetical protein
MDASESFQDFQVVVAVETEDNVNYPVVETQQLNPADVAANYDWADEDHTLIKKKDMQL